MSFSSQFHIPGAYNFDPPTTTTGHALSAGLFRPPVSPESASSSVHNLAKSTGSLYSDISMINTPATNAKRKRTRADAARESTPYDWSYMNMNMDGASDMPEDSRTFAGGRQIRYTLAGQIETPGTAPLTAANGALEDSVYSDVDYRRALGPNLHHDDLESPSARFAELQLGTDSGAPVRHSGWSTLAISTIGGVVGKVWEFCKTGAFRGFYAGGGRGYDFKSSTSSQNGKIWCNEHDVPTLQADETPAAQLESPGDFLESDYLPRVSDYHEMNTPDTLPSRTSKRRQVRENDDLRRNWVVVEEPSPSGSGQGKRRIGSGASKAPTRAPTTRNSQPRYSTPTMASGRRISVPVSRLGNGTPGLTRRASLRVSHAGSPSLTAREPASFAPGRPPSRLSTPSRLPVPSQPSAGTGLNPFAYTINNLATSNRNSPSRPSSQHSRIPSPAPPSFPHSSTAPTNLRTHRRDHSTSSTASMAGTRRTRTELELGGVGDMDERVGDSPRLDAEAKQLAARRRAAERHADAKIDAFTVRLQEMIRQGKEALGTKVDVEYGGDGTGDYWSDED